MQNIKLLQFRKIEEVAGRLEAFGIQSTGTKNASWFIELYSKNCVAEEKSSFVNVSRSLIIQYSTTRKGT